MRLSFRAKLMLSYLALLLVMSGAFYLYFDRTLRTSVMQSLKENLVHEARLISVLASRDPDRFRDNPSLIAEEVGRSLTARVTLINQEGRVIGDSEVPREKLGELENHLQRPEVHDALHRGEGVSLRRSSTLHSDMLYVAVPCVIEGSGGGVVRLAQPLSVIDTSLKQMRSLLGIGLLIAFLLSLGFSELLARLTLRPLREVANIATGIGEGDFRRRVPPGPMDELGELGLAINEMAERIEGSIATRRDFIANASHELRTPIAVISGYAETLVNDALIEKDPSRAARFAGIIHTHSDRLKRLLDDILDLSRLETATITVSLRLWRLEDILRTVFQLFEQRFSDKGISVDKEGVAGCVVMADRERLEQVFVNLLDNALKHTPSGGRISIIANPVDDRVEISVSDSGVGIPEEHLSRIFERFYRADPGRSRDHGGTGLGLAIVKHIIHLHGGSISATSRPGQGTTFTFSLPAARTEVS